MPGEETFIGEEMDIKRETIGLVGVLKVKI